MAANLAKLTKTVHHLGCTAMQHDAIATFRGWNSPTTHITYAVVLTCKSMVAGQCYDITLI